MKWELIENGYHRRMRYVQFPEGLIVGETYGSTYENAGWAANVRGKLLGYYVTEGMAQKAVEVAVDESQRPEQANRHRAGEEGHR